MNDPTQTQAERLAALRGTEKELIFEALLKRIDKSIFQEVNYFPCKVEFSINGYKGKIEMK